MVAEENQLFPFKLFLPRTEPCRKKILLYLLPVGRGQAEVHHILVNFLLYFSQPFGIGKLISMFAILSLIEPPLIESPPIAICATASSAPGLSLLKSRYLCCN